LSVNVQPPPQPQLPQEVGVIASMAMAAGMKNLDFFISLTFD
jgi:hypothetical protein